MYYCPKHDIEHSQKFCPACERHQHHWRKIIDDTKRMICVCGVIRTDPLSYEEIKQNQYANIQSTN